MEAFVNFIILHKLEIISILFFGSELLSLIPWVKANGVIQFVFNSIASLYKKIVGEPNK